MGDRKEMYRLKKSPFRGYEELQRYAITQLRFPYVVEVRKRRWGRKIITIICALPPISDDKPWWRPFQPYTPVIEEAFCNCEFTKSFIKCPRKIYKVCMLGIRTKDYMTFLHKPKRELLAYYRSRVPIIPFDRPKEENKVIAHRTRSQTKRRNARKRRI